MTDNSKYKLNGNRIVYWYILLTSHCDQKVKLHNNLQDIKILVDNSKTCILSIFQSHVKNHRHIIPKPKLILKKKNYKSQKWTRKGKVYKLQIHVDKHVCLKSVKKILNKIVNDNKLERLGATLHSKRSYLRKTNNSKSRVIKTTILYIVVNKW